MMATSRFVLPRSSTAARPPQHGARGAAARSAFAPLPLVRATLGGSHAPLAHQLLRGTSRVQPRRQTFGPVSAAAEAGEAAEVLFGEDGVGDDGGATEEPFTLGLRRDAAQVLELGEPLGSGAMGVVRMATRKSDGQRFALKTISKTCTADGTGVDQKTWARKVRDEVALHFALSAVIEVVSVHDAFEDSRGVHLLLDLCEGGDLLSGAVAAFEETSAKSLEDVQAELDAMPDDAGEDPMDVDTIDDETEEGGEGERASTGGFKDFSEHWTPFSEAVAAVAIRSVLKGLAACHAHGVVHRDVKPANYLWMVMPNGERHLKLSDFGLATRIPKRGGKLRELCGTYAYLSPEEVKGMPYDYAADAWAAGVVAFMLLVGEPPFADREAIEGCREPTKDGLFRDIRKSNITRRIEDLPSLSPGAKSLLKGLLERDPAKRMTCKDAAEHYWVRENGVASHTDALAKAVVGRLQAYGSLGLVRRASLRAAFEAVDGPEGASPSRATALTSVDLDEALVAAVAAAAAKGCEGIEDEECSAVRSTSEEGDDAAWEVAGGGDVGGEGEGGAEAAAARAGGAGVVPLRGLRRSLEEHGADLAEAEWAALLRPMRGGMDRTDLAAVLAAPANARDDTSDFDWDAIARTAFSRLTEHFKVAESLPLEVIADEVCGVDSSDIICRVTLQEELSAADADGDGRLTLDEWIQLIKSEGIDDEAAAEIDEVELARQAIAERKAKQAKGRAEAAARNKARAAARAARTRNNKP